MMIPGVNETATGLKAGSAIVAALKGGANAQQWPNMHESLLALYAILDEWCAAGEQTSRRISEAHTCRELGISRGVVSMVLQTASFAGTASGDIEELMSPKARLVMRWSKVERRTAARRGLQTTLSVYFPELLLDLGRAVEHRRSFIVTNVNVIQSKLASLSEDDFSKLKQEHAETYVKLCVVTEDLANLIVERFPVDPLRPR